jgi:hypothetical protein
VRGVYQPDSGNDTNQRLDPEYQPHSGKNWGFFGCWLEETNVISPTKDWKCFLVVLYGEITAGDCSHWHVDYQPDSEQD